MRMTRHIRLPQRRTVLKAVHWLMLPLVIWFLFMTPEVVLRIGGETFFHIHSNVALVFVTLSLWWTASYLRRGLASRPGPKLPPWARLFHQVLHKVLIYGLFGVAITVPAWADLVDPDARGRVPAHCPASGTAPRQ